MDTQTFDTIPLDCPHMARCMERFSEARKSMPGIDGKVRQLISIAVQTAAENHAAVKYHAALARAEGATPHEIVDAVLVNLRHQEIVPVLECLQSAIDGSDLCR